jgi:hypothetical protein
VVPPPRGGGGGGGPGKFFLNIFFYKDKSRNLSKIVLVLLSASVERVGVSRMQFFFFKVTSMCSELQMVEIALR